MDREYFNIYCGSLRSKEREPLLLSSVSDPSHSSPERSRMGKDRFIETYLLEMSTVLFFNETAVTAQQCQSKKMFHLPRLWDTSNVLDIKKTLLKCVCGGLHPTVFRAYSWVYAEGSLLAGSWGHEVLGIKPGLDTYRARTLLTVLPF